MLVGLLIKTPPFTPIHSAFIHLTGHKVQQRDFQGLKMVVCMFVEHLKRTQNYVSIIDLHVRYGVSLVPMEMVKNILNVLPISMDEYLKNQQVNVAMQK
jgi:hypothetical protein